MKVINTTKNIILAQQGVIADSFSSRIKGLLGREKLERGETLILTNCRQIHMFFMRFAIDAVFLDKNHKVVGLVKNILPFRCSPIFWHAHLAIELPAGTIQATNTQIDDIIKIEA